MIGLDNINDYYEVSLKYARLHQLGIEKESASVFSKISESTVTWQSYAIHSYEFRRSY